MTHAEIAEAYLNALEEQNFEAVSEFLTDDATIEIPLSNTGELSPWFVFEGKKAAQDYIRTIFQNFGQVKLLDRSVYVADDGRTVFVEAKGDLVQRSTNSSYRNVYIFKFSIRDNKVERVSEYANPVTFAKLMGMALG